MNNLDRRFVQTSVPGLVRDARTGAVINNNDVDYNNFLNERARRMQQQNLSNKVEKLERNMEEIKNLLNVLVNKNGN
mgnify:CR=1 FL=1